eukprot:TRINITY_DN9095_c0_g1_i1.p1 TRINITY_DN9095_c0_g1~~TRINITY_DN9095_c0_g1_i1.p1  ORF type:complete len:298 (-),score=69.43 TRINITY_DN9095_c0_g1_i1:652-1545(-)
MPVQWAQGGGGGQYHGTVKLFNQQKGWGMIACEQTQQQYGKDVFFMKSAIANGLVTSGERVRFSIRTEAKGPVATEVQSLSYSGLQPVAYGMGGYPMMGAVPPYLGVAGQLQTAAAMGQLPLLASAIVPRLPPANQTYYGTIISFNEEKGWGFISCEVTKKLFNKDVFVMRGVLKGVEVKANDFVSFKVEMGMKGPQAAELAVLPPGCIGADGRPGQTFEGTVKKFDAEKGWGFVEGDDIAKAFGKDIFVHKRELSDQAPTSGDRVTFTVEMDNNGQPQAKNVTVTVQALAASPCSK